MAFWVRLTLLLAADSHLNTGLGSMQGKAELLYRFKGTPQSFLSSVFKTSSCISLHQLKGPLRNPQSPLGGSLHHQALHFSMNSFHCFLPNTKWKGVWWWRKREGKCGPGSGEGKGRGVLWLSADHGWERKERKVHGESVKWPDLQFWSQWALHRLYFQLLLKCSPCKECSCTGLTWIATSDSGKHSYRVKY